MLKSAAKLSALRASMLAEDAAAITKKGKKEKSALKDSGKPLQSEGAVENGKEDSTSDKPKAESSKATRTPLAKKSGGVSAKEKIATKSSKASTKAEGEKSTRKSTISSDRFTGVRKIPSTSSTPSSVAQNAHAFIAAVGGESRPGDGNVRRTIIELLQSSKLKNSQALEGVRLLRRMLTLQPTPSTSIPDGQDLKSALLNERQATSQSNKESASVSTGRAGSKIVARKPPGPVQIARDVTEYEIKTIDSNKLQLVPLESDGIEVPRLSYGLDRVLFNPGVYHLQDPRSRVFNFDPYLQTIMPVHEFDFNALKQYITSSRDQTLLRKTREQKKKYTGSTSSMTSALAHFHFLLSQWRPISTGNLSKMFPVEYKTFTALQRGPNAIFLRHKDGVYAIDADKQYDTANILMMLGKSMEKLLTLSTDEFERYRRTNSDQISEEERNAEEAFHYTTMGDFLMRSQLDAYDPRLPGTGMFDLKTRAVVSVRMDADQYEEARGYQIRNRVGEWESYEREYYDMIRAAFLKYSLQVRMGRMDGIFVAFHNTERIFGFQYISLPEMDFALHGTEDTTLGDTEFKLSLELLNRALDRATAKFPGKSLRLHFETRDAATPFMYIFAEPIEEQRIDQIQSTNKAKIEEFERKILGLADQDLSDQERKAEWDSLRAEVEDSMELDEQESEEPEEPDDARYVSPEQEYDADAHESRGLTATEERDMEEKDSEEAPDDAESKGESDLDSLSDEDLREMEKLLSLAPENPKQEDGEEGDLLNSCISASSEERITEGAESLAGKEDDLIEDCHLAQDSLAKAAESSDSPIIHVQEHILDEIEVRPEEVAEAALAQAEMDVTGECSVEDSLDNQGQRDPSLASEEPEVIDNTDSASEENGGKEVLGMTLTIRNKINGEYVVRPRRLDNGQNWEVEYALEELPPKRAVALYRACLVRRKRNLIKPDDVKPDKWNDKFIQTIKQLSKKGKAWREQQDLAEQKQPLKTLYPVDGVVIQPRERDIFSLENNDDEDMVEEVHQAADTEDQEDELAKSRQAEN
jgi:hypothetical protein